MQTVDTDIRDVPMEEDSGMNKSVTQKPFLVKTSTGNNKFPFRTNLHHGLQQVPHIRHQLMVWRQTVSYSYHLILHAILGNRQWLLESHQLLLQCFHCIWNKACLLQQTEPLGTKFKHLHRTTNTYSLATKQTLSLTNCTIGFYLLPHVSLVNCSLNM